MYCFDPSDSKMYSFGKMNSKKYKKKIFIVLMKCTVSQMIDMYKNALV